MSIRDDFFAAKAQGSLWDVAVSIKRGNPLPLDADSIFDSLFIIYYPSFNIKLCII